MLFGQGKPGRNKTAFEAKSQAIAGWPGRWRRCFLFFFLLPVLL
jgi:hypothetical protein